MSDKTRVDVLVGVTTSRTLDSRKARPPGGSGAHRLLFLSSDVCSVLVDLSRHVFFSFLLLRTERLFFPAAVRRSRMTTCRGGPVALIPRVKGWLGRILVLS